LNIAYSGMIFSSSPLPAPPQRGSGEGVQVNSANALEVPILPTAGVQKNHAIHFAISYQLLAEGDVFILGFMLSAPHPIQGLQKTYRGRLHEMTN
jgi:hypothetical protein